MRLTAIEQVVTDEEVAFRVRCSISHVVTAIEYEVTDKELVFLVRCSISLEDKDIQTEQ